MGTKPAVRVLAAVVMAVFVGFACLSSAADTAAESEIVKALGQVKLFAGLTDAEKTVLQSAATVRQGTEGERIIEQGKTLDHMWIVLEGQAEVRVNGKVVATLPAQSLIGEMEFLGAFPAAANVYVLKNTRLIELNNAALTKLMEEHPRLGYVLMSEFARIEARRLRAMDLK
ncbi:MAG: cyclic nucleotide-binding domain-containing protein [Deltaproteobacteria bacterium]|nr:cyclic nucleotide-binding domain-containing protein [Deltaproteobacteria bacterium]